MRFPFVVKPLEFLRQDLMFLFQVIRHAAGIAFIQQGLEVSSLIDSSAHFCSAAIVESRAGIQRMGKCA